jgi:ClpP class serine protease
MPTWNELLNEAKEAGSTYDVIRRKYLKKLFECTGRNVILYYSGWQQKPLLAREGARFELNDADKNGFMSVIHKLDRKKGVDLLLHTPGGSMAATESLVDYLRSMFGTNIRAVVPQLALSAGTMVALACKEIIMGKHSSIGPIDPQIGGVSAHGVMEEFVQAKTEVHGDQTAALIWQPIFAKYNPTLIGDCQKAILWSAAMVKEWLITGMFEGEVKAKAEEKADKVIQELADHALTKSHDRHISANKATDIGLNVRLLEADPALQEAVLSVHHACIQTLADTPAYKVIENQNGTAFIQQLRVMAIKA